MIRKILGRLFGEAAPPREIPPDDVVVAGPIDVPRRVNALVSQLQHRQWLQRRRAAQELGTLGSDARPASVALMETLVDVRPEVRRAADQALARIDPSWRSNACVAEAVPTLIRALAGDRAPDVSLAAGETLDRLGVAAGPGLARFVREEENLYLQILAVRAIAKLGPKGAPAVATLIAALKAQPHALREAAAQALEQIGPAASAAVEPLRALANDSFARVKEAAAAALAKIGRGT